MFYFKSSCKANDIAQLCLASARATESFFPQEQEGGGWLGAWGSTASMVGQLLPVMAMLALTHTSDHVLARVLAQFWAQTHNLAPIDLHSQ